MAVHTAGDLTNLWSDLVSFYAEDHKTMDKLVDVYHGILPTEFDDYFDDEMHVHLVNMIRLAWDDLANLTGKVFPVYVEPDNQTPTARTRAETQEKVAYGWMRAGRIVGGISKDLLQKVLAWWMVGCANAVAMVLPDFEHKTPYFTFRDPRTFYPPAGWSPYTQAEPEFGLFAYQITIGELLARYPDLGDEIRQKLMRTLIGHRTITSNESSWVWVGEYYHEDSWMVTTLTDNTVTLARTDSGDRGHPGVQPVVPMGLYSPQGAKGRSLFADQVSIQAAIARMFSQKLDFFDRTLYPMIFHTRLSGQTIRIGPYATNEYDPSDGFQPKVDTVAPAHQVDADATMAFALGLSRMLNRNPESMQGAGEADSAKALEALKSGITTTIRDGFWPPMIEAEPKLLSLASKIDVRLWGNIRKVAKGKRKNGPFRINYVPATLLRGREDDWEVEAGLGLAGYQGTIEILQLLGAEQIPERMALEQRDDVRNAEEAYRMIQGDRIQKVVFADLATKAQEGMLVGGALARIWRRVLSGEELYEVIEEMDAAGELYIAPPSPDELLGQLGPGGPTGGPGGLIPPGERPVPTSLAALRGR